MLSHFHEKYGEEEEEKKKKKGEKRWHRGRGELRVDCITDILVSDVTVRKAIRFTMREADPTLSQCPTRWRGDTIV